MKKKDLDEMKKLETKELKKSLERFKKDLANLQVEVSLGKVKNLHSLSAKKKDIARIMTIISLESILTKVEKDQKIEKSVEKKKEAKGGTR